MLRTGRPTYSPDKVDPVHSSTTDNHAHADQKHTQACTTPKRATCFPAACLRDNPASSSQNIPQSHYPAPHRTTNRACRRQKTLAQQQGSDRMPRPNKQQTLRQQQLAQFAQLVLQSHRHCCCQLLAFTPCKHPGPRQFLSACIPAASCCFSWCADMIPCFTAAP
jgi:hypothetical protein